MISTHVAVVGAGPVGLLASLLLSKFGINYTCFQKFDKLRSHPSAHWVSGRSKQILSQIDGLCQQIDNKQQTFNNFKYYRYCDSIGGNEFGRSNHFLPSIQQKLKISFNYFKEYPSHIGQDKLLNIEYQFIDEKQRILFDQQIISIQKKDNKYQLINNRQQIICRCDYIILCNGFNSLLRNQIGIKIKEGRQFYKLINIHFKSQELASIIKLTHSQAMLHFIYNSKIPSVLVNHSLQNGQFVLQIPNYQPFIDLLQIYSPKELIQMAISSSFLHQINNLQIIHVGRWKLQARIAQKMSVDNIFLAGDTAHTYTPAGGFGMNCGFQDINQLIHTIHLLSRNAKANKMKLFNMYNSDRLTTNQKYLQKSLKNYQITDQIANQLGFPSQLTQYFFSFCRFLPQSNIPLGMNFTQKMRLLAMKGLFRPKQIEPKLDLFFDEFDFNVQPLSSQLPQMIKQIKKNNVHDIWVDYKVNSDEIIDIFGQIDQSNIKRLSLKSGERIIRRDGIIIK